MGFFSGRVTCCRYRVTGRSLNGGGREVNLRVLMAHAGPADGIRGVHLQPTRGRRIRCGGDCGCVAGRPFISKLCPSL